MQTLDLKKILKESGADYQTIAKTLFPDHKFPIKALLRVIKGEGDLGSMQISKLALLLGKEITDLYTNRWSAMPSNKKGVVSITKEDFTAELDTNTGITKIFHNKSLFHESVICKGTIPVSEYVKEIETIIKNR